MNFMFWASTLIPGLAVLSIVTRHETQRGFFGSLAWSFVLTVAVITPVIVVAHLMHLQASTVATVYVALVILGVIGIIKFGHWSRFTSSLRLMSWPELVVILSVILVSIEIGGQATYDSLVYAAKIQYLQGVGFSLQDPYSPLEVLESRYLVNAYFGIHAVGCWLTGTEPIDMLFESVWFFRLLELGGIEFLALSLFKARWIATTSVLGALFFIVSENSVAHPRYLAAFLVFPVLLACLLEVLQRQTALRYLKIATASLAMAVIHVGIFLMTIICLFPSLGIWHLLRDRFQISGRAVFVAAAALVLPGLPFLLMTAIQPTPNWNQLESWGTFSLYTLPVGEFFNLYMLKPFSYSWMMPTGVVLTALLIVHKTNPKGIAFVGTVLLTVILVMFNPLILTPLMQLFPSWIVERAQLFAQVIALVAIPGWLAVIAENSMHTRKARVVFSSIVLAGGMVLFQSNIKAIYYGMEKQQYMLQRAREIRETLESVHEDRPLIAADSTLSLMIPAVKVSAVMAPFLTHSNPADPTVIERHDDARNLLSRDTSEERRKEIIAKYDIDYVLIGSHRGRGANEAELDLSQFRRWDDLVVEHQGFQLFRLEK